MTNKPSSIYRTFWYCSHSQSDVLCTRSERTFQTESSKQQHTVFTTTQSNHLPVDSLDVLWVTALLCLQSDTHRRLWNIEEQCAELSTDRAVAGFWIWKKYLHYQKQLQNQCQNCWLGSIQINVDQKARRGLIFPLSCMCLGFSRQCQYLSNSFQIM